MRFLLHYIVLPVALVAGNFFSYAQFTIYNTSNSGLPDNRVNKVVLDKNQNIWCATEYGVAMYNGTSWTVYNSSNSGLTDNYTRCIAFDSLNRLWVGTLSSGIFIYDGVTWQQIYSGNSGLSDDCVKDIQFDANGHWWIGTTGGLNYYDSTSWTVWNVFNSSFYTNNISFIRFKGSEKHVGTVNGGLHILDSVNSITNYNSFNSGIHDNTLPDGEWDAAGALWLATPAAGIMVHYVGNTWQWYYTGTSNIPTNSLNAICRYGNNFYMTSYDNGFIRYSAGSFTGWNTSNSLLPEDYLLDVAHDSTGHIWLGSYQSGLIRVDEASLGLTTEYTHNTWSLWNNLVKPGESLLIHAPDDCRAVIYDQTGKLLCRPEIESGKIHVQNLAAGIYQLVVSNTNHTRVFRFSVISN